MEILKTYEYRMEYSKEVFSSTQKMVLADDTPRQAVTAESILLGLKVRLGVLVEVYESGLMEGEEFLEQLTTGFKEMINKSQDEMKKLVGEDKKSTYEGFSEYVVDLKYVKSEINGYVKSLNAEE